MQHKFDIVVIGGGPAGIAAATAAAESGKTVCLLDDNPRLGGQIWRGKTAENAKGPAQRWYRRFERARVHTFFGASAFHAADGVVFAETPEKVLQIRFQSLILATGARERFLPFPGWTLNNVVGAGGLQAMVKGGLEVAGKHVVIAGTGPLLLAVAVYLRQQKARILCVCEQAPFTKLFRFGLGTVAYPGKWTEAVRLATQLRGISFKTDCWPVAALGKEKVEAVRLRHRGKEFELDCDYLACGFHLVPNIEFAAVLGCEISDGIVVVDEFQRTTLPGIYCAGEPTGIGGVELALLEGQIAGFSAGGRFEQSKTVFSARAKYKNFARGMDSAFALRDELKKLPDGDTLFCRCEDVTFHRAAQYGSWRAAKLQTRCGMGPCQGRICGAAAEFLFGWQVDSMRPPIFPVRCASLAALQPPEEIVNSNPNRSTEVSP